MDKTHCAIPLQIDTLIIYLPCQNKRKHFNEFFFFILKSTREHLFPPRQEAEDMSPKTKRQAQIFLHIEREFYPHKREREKKKTNKHLTGMFSLKKKKTPRPIDQILTLLLLQLGYLTLSFPPPPRPLFCFKLSVLPQTHTHTLCFTNRFTFVYNTRPSQLQAIQVSIYLYK